MQNIPSYAKRIWKSIQSVRSANPRPQPRFITCGAGAAERMMSAHGFRSVDLAITKSTTEPTTDTGLSGRGSTASLTSRYEFDPDADYKAWKKENGYDDE